MRATKQYADLYTEHERVQEKLRSQPGETRKRDTRYQVRVDGLIALATQEADSLCGPEPSKLRVAAHDAWERAWNRTYHVTMDELARAHGYRTQAWQAEGGSLPELGWTDPQGGLERAQHSFAF